VSCARWRARGRESPDRDQDGKRVVFGEDISINTVGNGSVRVEVDA
jgi:hypothetical protein